MKYYLLTFNEDWADEHNVPALACFTEDQFKTWLESPSGELNLNYEQENKEYQQKLNDYDNFMKECLDRNLSYKKPSDYTKEEREWFDRNQKPHISFHMAPNRCDSNISAWLGNSGDDFEENYNHLYLMKEFVDSKIVKVLEVDEGFYNYFNTAQLSNLSLCNIFQI